MESARNCVTTGSTQTVGLEHRQRIHHHGFALSLVVAMHAWFVVCAYPPPQPEGLTTDSWLSQHTCVCAMIYGYRENEINASASKANHLSRKHAHRFLAFETHTCVCNLYGNVFVQPHTHTHTPTDTGTTVTMQSWLYAAFNACENTWNTSQIPQPDA